MEKNFWPTKDIKLVSAGQEFITLAALFFR